MDAKQVLEIVLREMTAIGQGWRTDWSEFDGRTLRLQLDKISKFANEALQSDEVMNCTLGTEFLEKQSGLKKK